MPSPIHPIQAAGSSAIPLSLESLQSAPSAASTNYATATRYAAFACDHSGALILPNGPIQPAVSLGSIAWPALGYTVTFDSSGALSSKTTNATAYTSTTSTDRSSNAKIFFLSQGAASTDYFPRIQRSTALPKNLLASLPEASPRAGSFPILGGSTAHSEYFQQNYASNNSDYFIKAERREYPGILLSFPLLGVKRIRLNIGYDITLDGSSMHPSGSITVPLRACFVPVKAESRLTHWPTWPDTLSFDAQYSAYYGSGLIPPQTLDLKTTLYALVDKQFAYAQWEIDIPPSGLALFWVELDPFQYLDFAKEMLRVGYDMDHWQRLYFRAQIKNAIALP